MSIKRSLNICMAKRDMKITDVAEKLGVTKQAIYNYMLKDARLSTIDKLAKLFNMKTSEFLALGEECDG